MCVCVSQLELPVTVGSWCRSAHVLGTAGVVPPPPPPPLYAPPPLITPFSLLFIYWKWSRTFLLSSSSSSVLCHCPHTACPPLLSIYSGPLSPPVIGCRPPRLYFWPPAAARAPDVSPWCVRVFVGLSGRFSGLLWTCWAGVVPSGTSQVCSRREAFVMEGEGRGEASVRAPPPLKSSRRAVGPEPAGFKVLLGGFWWVGSEPHPVITSCGIFIYICIYL